MEFFDGKHIEEGFGVLKAFSAITDESWIRKMIGGIMEENRVGLLQKY